MDEYRRKRKFDATPEPSGATSRRNGPEVRERTFVIQKHDASRLHYDFRLETEDGILKSWAIPKGVSMDPDVKRLAVLTEDHPISYASFEGVIPKGNYGAGTVIVWDNGTYSTDSSFSRQFEQGKIQFVLNGKKVKGAFSLVRMKDTNKQDNVDDSEKQQWLLIKSKDEFVSKEDLTISRPESVIRGNSPQTDEEARKAKIRKMVDLSIEIRQQMIPKPGLPIRPMLAMPVDEPFDDKDWVFEVKWDGIRGIYVLDKKNNFQTLQARKGTSISHRYPELIEAAGKAIHCQNSVILDGEIVVLDETGKPNFQRHQQRMNVDYPRDIDRLSKEIPATYYVFDILYLDGKNLEKLGFLERRKILDGVIQSASERIRVSDFIDKDGISLFKNTAVMGLEGIVAKYKRGKYFEGTRSDNWLKIKSILTQDCVVIGYTPGEGNREGYFGSLILAANKDGKLRFVGHSGSGFGFDVLGRLYEKLQDMKVDECPIDEVAYVNRTPIWVIPELVVEVKFNGWTRDRIMRAPIFLRTRDDKLPSECVIEQPEDANSAVQQAERTASPDKQNTAKVSNPSKIFWPATKEHRALTKANLIEYYEKVSEFILPHLKDRPISMSRYPDGINGKSFYQKDWSQDTPDSVKTVKVFSESRNGIINYVLCKNKETLLWLANLGCIEMHPWYSRVLNYDVCMAEAKKDRIQIGQAPLDEDMCGLDTPDFVVFDLDPYVYSGNEKKGQEPEYNVPGFKAAVEVALYLHDLLNELGIMGYVKTSGKTGLHIFVPVEPNYSFEQTRSFAEIMGKILLMRHPRLVTMNWNTSKREGKVFFDYNQNVRGKTIASVFSVRPTISATASMPLDWTSLAEALPSDFTIENVPAFLKKKGDPWKDILKRKQDLASILEDVQRLKP